MIPAIIIGNTVLFKLPKVVVLFFQTLPELLEDCFSPGVVNAIYGEGTEVATLLVKSEKNTWRR
ncbi:MAG: aldehyde dehydrogenase family protein [Bacteroidales bacterium]